MDATHTRVKLIRSGERLFAERGLSGASIGEILKASGQANESAVHYHFGSRAGLIRAICDDHILRMEPDRLARVERYDGGVPDLDVLVSDMVESTAAELADQSGRWFLRIVTQLISSFTVERLPLPASLDGGALATQLELLERILSTRLPHGIALERHRLVISMFASELGYRAAAIDQGQQMILDHDAFLENLTVIIVAVLTAPVPASAARRPRRRGERVGGATPA